MFDGSQNGNSAAGHQRTYIKIYVGVVTESMVRSTVMQLQSEA